MTLQGKGFFIWKVPDCENGDSQAIANVAKQANFSHVLVKIADGTSSYNVTSSGIDLVPAVVQALHAQNIQVWGWHYIYGNDPVGEANKAIARLQQTGADGYVLDVEGEYKEPGKDKAAVLFMDRMRAVFPNLPMALSSYRFPSYHPQVPWEEFLTKCDYNMPQVYWQYAHNPADQLIRSVREFQAMTPFRPIFPTGSAYQVSGWAPTPGEVTEFLQTTQSLNLSGANFWEWANTRRNLPAVWDAIADYPWAATPPPQDIAEAYIAALNTHDPNQVVQLYTPTAVHVNAARTVQGSTAMLSWYQTLFAQVLPNATFNLTGFSGTGSSRHLTWTAVSTTGNVQNGNDTLGLIDGKIAYHYTFFTIG